MLDPDPESINPDQKHWFVVVIVHDGHPDQRTIRAPDRNHASLLKLFDAVADLWTLTFCLLLLMGFDCLLHLDLLIVPLLIQQLGLHAPHSSTQAQNQQIEQTLEQRMAFSKETQERRRFDNQARTGFIELLIKNTNFRIACTSSVAGRSRLIPIRIRFYILMLIRIRIIPLKRKLKIFQLYKLLKHI